MRPFRHIRHSAALLAVTALVATGSTTPSPASGAAPVAVRAATTTAAEVEAALAAAEGSAAAASTRALEAAETATRARAEADAAAQRVADLDALAHIADTQLTAAVARAAAVATTRYRDSAGGALLGELLASAEPETLLARLALLDRVDAASLRIVGTAQETAEIARSLGEQAARADAESARLATEAETEAARAQAEADAEASAVAAAQSELDALYARLAALQRTSVAAAKQTRLDQQTAAQPSAGGSGTTPATPTGPSTPVAPVPPVAPATPVAPVTPTVPAETTIMTPAQAQAHARSVIGGYGWGDEQFSCLVSLWNRESGWRVQARNPSSGAYGIPQAYPAEKLATAGADWRTSAPTQIAWGLSYIKNRYGSPCGAWAHSQSTGWY